MCHTWRLIVPITLLRCTGVTFEEVDLAWRIQWRHRRPADHERLSAPDSFDQRSIWRCDAFQTTHAVSIFPISTGFTACLCCSAAGLPGGFQWRAYPRNCRHRNYSASRCSAGLGEGGVRISLRISWTETVVRSWRSCIRDCKSSRLSRVVALKTLVPL